MSTPSTKPAYDLSDALELGKVSEYASEYAPQLLQAVPRSLSRDQIGLSNDMPFQGVDIWNGYELSWLNKNGKPRVAILRCWVPITSANLIESKSFKLYLNSFNQTKFESSEAVIHALKHDLSQTAGDTVDVTLLSMQELAQTSLASLPGSSIDDIDINIEHYSPISGILKNTLESANVTETLYSDLLKSNCLITNQPDWASIMIRYTGPQIDRASLLEYLISFRQHNEFHEQCVERIFCDIERQCNTRELTVYARYTRRGGLDINPFRSNFEQPYADGRLPRQ